MTIKLYSVTAAKFPKNAIYIARKNSMEGSCADMIQARSALDATIQSAVDAENEACAVLLESLSQVRIPEPFRRCDFYEGLDEDQEGWRRLSIDEKAILMSAAKAIRARRTDTRKG